MNIHLGVDGKNFVAFLDLVELGPRLGAVTGSLTKSTSGFGLMLLKSSPGWSANLVCGS